MFLYRSEKYVSDELVVRVEMRVDHTDCPARRRGSVHMASSAEGEEDAESKKRGKSGAAHRVEITSVYG